MLESDYKRSIGAMTVNHSDKKQLINFNSLMHNSSQFDRGNLSTLDNSMITNNHYTISTEINPIE